jgi:hypothetical protein
MFAYTLALLPECVDESFRTPTSRSPFKHWTFLIGPASVYFDWVNSGVTSTSTLMDTYRNGWMVEDLGRRYSRSVAEKEVAHGAQCKKRWKKLRRYR